MALMYLRLVLVNLFAVLCFNSPLVNGETGCPPPEDIEPCVCTDDPATRLSCHDVNNLSVMRDVFKNSERYFYQEVYIRSSTMVFLPHEIFDNTKVGELFIMSTTLMTLFDQPPRSDSFYKLHLEATRLQEKNFLKSGVLKNVTSLRIVSVQRSTLSKISPDFSTKFPSSLKQISFNDTGIKKIYPGALDGLENLDKFAVQYSKLTNLTRDMFPRPFNVRFLYFDHNNIDFIAEDLFTEMPNLQFLTMRYNYLSVIPEAAFGGRSSNVPYLRFEGNPLKCNCLLVWLIKDKPEVIGGTCSTPKRLQGKHLQALSPADFNC